MTHGIFRFYLIETARSTIRKIMTKAIRRNWEIARVQNCMPSRIYSIMSSSNFLSKKGKINICSRLFHTLPNKRLLGFLNRIKLRRRIFWIYFYKILMANWTVKFHSFYFILLQLILDQRVRPLWTNLNNWRFCWFKIAHL